MKIAWFVPSSRSDAVRKFSAMIVQELSKLADVTVFAFDRKDWVETAPANFEVQFVRQIAPIDLSAWLARYDVLIYNIEDNPVSHETFHEIALRQLVIIIVHDLTLQSTHSLAESHDSKASSDFQFNIGERFHARRRTEPVEKWGNSAHSSLIKAMRDSYGVIVHSQSAKDVLTPLSSIPVRQFPFPAADTKSYCLDLIGFIETALYNKPVFDLADFAAGLLADFKADAGTAPALAELLTREIEVLAVPAANHSTPKTQLKGIGRKPLFVIPSGGRWAETRQYYTDFPVVVQPYLVINPKSRTQYMGGPKGLYGFVRNLLVRLNLQSVVERLLGPRLILTVRFFFSYPRVSDLYVVPPSTVVKKLS